MGIRVLQTKYLITETEELLLHGVRLWREPAHPACSQAESLQQVMLTDLISNGCSSETCSAGYNWFNLPQTVVVLYKWETTPTNVINTIGLR